MEVLSNNDGLVTNIEVLELMRERQAAHESKYHTSLLENREHIEKSTIKYLQDKMKDTGKGKGATVAMNTQFLAEIARLSALPITEKNSLRNVRLTEAELVELSNHQPKAEVELLLLILDCHVRCTEDQVNVILNAVRTCFELDISS